MPGMRGFDVAGDTRRDSVWCWKFWAAGMDGYVSKPISAKELFSVIDELVAGQAEALSAPTREMIISRA